MKLRRRLIYFGVSFAVITSIGVSLWIRHNTEPIGQSSSNGLVLNGTKYVADNERPIQTLFLHRVGRTQDGDAISAIHGEDPKDFVYVVGDMWEGVYRRATFPAPQFHMQDITRLVLEGISSSKKPFEVTVTNHSAIQDVVDRINSNQNPIEKLPTENSTAIYGVDIYEREYPGLMFPMLIEAVGRHLYLQTSMQSTAYATIDGTTLARFLNQQIN